MDGAAGVSGGFWPGRPRGASPVEGRDRLPEGVVPLIALAFAGSRGSTRPVNTADLIVLLLRAATALLFGAGGPGAPRSADPPT